LEVAVLKKPWVRALVVAAMALALLAGLALVVLGPTAFSLRLWIFLVLLALLAGGGSLFWSRPREEASGDLDNLLKDLAAGNLALGADTHSAAVMQQNPGFQRVVRSFQSIISYLMDTSESVSTASSQISDKTRNLFRDTREELESLTEAGRSAHQLEDEISRIVEGVDKLSGFTERTSSAMLQMRASIEEVVSATHNLSDLVDEASASMEEMTRSFEEVAGHTESLSSFAIQNSSAMVQMDATNTQIEEHIRETEGISNQVAQVAQSGVKVVKETVAGLEKIQSAMNASLSSINSLGLRSKEIGKILKVIREIADQTNLLALNAAIIAAQAGEHGKSFGVVAEEIRDLSERTAASTAEVSAIITTIQRDVDEAQTVAREGMTRVEDGVRLGRASEENLQRIHHAIDLARNNVTHIARAASEQAKGSRQVTAAIEEMTKRIERISIATREQAKTSQHINAKSLTMKELTRSVDRAMQEEATGSNTITEGMEQVSSSVESIHTAILHMSQAVQKIVLAVDVIRGASQQNVAGARDLAATSAKLRQEALLVVEELGSFNLPQPSHGGELRVGYVNYDYKLDPAYANNLRDGELASNAFEGLLRMGYGTGLIPALAHEWTISVDSRVYTFRLRPNATFHNGRKVTAQDVVFSWHRALSPKLDNEGKWFLGWVEGVDEYMAGKAGSILGLKAPDDRTVEVTLKEPLAFFLSMLAGPEAAILPKEAVDERTLRMVKPVGTGPFSVASATPNEVVFERHRTYYQQGIPYVDRLVMDYSSRSEEELAGLLREGRVHLTPAFSNDYLEKLLSDPFWENHAESTVLLSTMVVSLRNDLSPTSIKELRQAMNYAVDREEFVSQYKHSKATPAKGILPPGILGYKADRRGYYHDPEKARWLLNKAGFSNGLDLRIAVDASRVRQYREFVLLVEMLGRVGIRIEAETVSHEEFDARRKRSGRPLLYSTGWYADYPDPDAFLYVLFHSKAGDALELHYQNPKLDELVEKGRRTLDMDERIEVYEKAEDLVIEDAPCIFLYHARGVIPHRPEVHGLKLSTTPPVMRPWHIWMGE
jgi:ABC-type transport system substrate-binding protein/ABC-type transporter Mla subunit MlaD